MPRRLRSPFMITLVCVTVLAFGLGIASLYYNGGIIISTGEAQYFAGIDAGRASLARMAIGTPRNARFVLARDQDSVWRWDFEGQFTEFHFFIDVPMWLVMAMPALMLIVLCRNGIRQWVRSRFKSFPSRG